MNPLMLLTQLLPLLVFILVDAFVKDVRISIGCAIVFAIGQMIFTYIRVGQFDWFILLDVGLIVALGGVAIVFKNELFFKIKPAIVEAVAIIFMLFLIMAKDSFLVGYFARLMPDMKFQPEMVGLMKTILVWMCVYVGSHIGAVLYTAFYTSKRMWALVSGPGFYLIFIPIMGYIFFKAILKRFATSHEISEN